MMTQTDERYMRRALELAAYARGRTSPNPMVGAVIVRDGRIVGEGWHHKAGLPHAEINALAMAGEEARGATLYVTLEPCVHQGRTPPCVGKVIESGLKRVVVAMQDPNPAVNGRGLMALRKADIAVDVGLCEDEARRLNEVFCKWIVTEQPFVTLKLAISLDGKIATVKQQSRWITSEAARMAGHHLRDVNDAIVIGVGTLLTDDPELTARLPDGSGHNPVRVILDSFARTPLQAKVLTDHAAPTIVVVSRQAPAERVEALRNAGADVLTCGTSTRVDVNNLLEKLNDRELTSVLVEGGANVNFSFLQAGVVDKVVAYIAPKLIGGKTALTAVEGAGFPTLADAVVLDDPTVQMLGDNLCYTAYVRK